MLFIFRKINTKGCIYDVVKIHPIDCKKCQINKQETYPSACHPFKVRRRVDDKMFKFGVQNKRTLSKIQVISRFQNGSKVSLSPTEASSVHLLALRRNTNYSTTWQSVDADLQKRQHSKKEEHNQHSKFDAPDPLNYLRQLDLLPSLQPYRNSLLKSLDLQNNPNDLVLDVGCGLGGGTTHHEISKLLKSPLGHLTGVDISEQLLQEATQRSHDLNYNHKVSYKQASAYNLPFSNQTFNLSIADRLFQHLIRPFDALQEMIRVTKDDGLIVIADPDFRTFQIDVTGGGCNNRYNPNVSYASHNYQENYNVEAGRRWAHSGRPPPHLQFDMGGLTSKVLGYVIPTLSAHSFIGSSQPRLLRSAGLEDIEIDIVPVVLQGRSDLEACVPITYMSQLAVDNSNGGLSRHEADLWLERLEWEGDDYLFGSLNFYISRGVKPTHISPSNRRARPLYSTRISSYRSIPVITPPENVICRFACRNNDTTLIQEAENTINNEYASSDTGITLCSGRLDEGDALVFAANKQLILALDENTGDLLGTIQIKIKDHDKTKSSKEKGTKGLPNLSGVEKVAEFTCLAVKSGKTYLVENIKTLAVKVTEIESNASNEKSKNVEPSSQCRRGVGAALVRYAEAYAHSCGCTKMQLAIMCPDVAPQEEPKLKQKLQKYYLKLGYEHHSSIGLQFELDDEGNVVKDEMNDMYKSLNQLVKCKAIVMQKSL